MSFSRRTVLAVALALAVFALRVPAPSSAAGSAMLRVVHASPDTPAIEVLIDGQKTLSALQFTEATAYISVPSGRHQIVVLSATAGSGGKAFIDTSVDLQDGQAYTVVAADRLANIEPVVLVDDLTRLAATQAYVRLVHASPDAPPVADVAVSDGGPTVFRSVPFKGATEYLAVAPGSYRFDLRPAGSSQWLATTNAIALDAGRSYTVFAMGQLGNNTFQAIIVPDNARTGGVSGVPSTGGGGASGGTDGSRFLGLMAACCVALVLLSIRRRRLSLARVRAGSSGATNQRLR